MSVHIDSLSGLSLLLLFHRFGWHLWLESLLTCHCWHHESLHRQRFLGFEIFTPFSISIRDLWALDRFLKLDIDIFLLSKIHSRGVSKHLSLFIFRGVTDNSPSRTEFGFRIVKIQGICLFLNV